jgi:acetylornithine deacetylase
LELQKGHLMQTRIVNILSTLVEINSVNSTLSAGPGEKHIAEFIYKHLSKLQLDVKIQTVTGNRSNVVAVIPGQDRSRSLMLNGHLDTVGVDGMDDPFTLKPEEDKLFGRGAYDMKGSLAVMLLLAEYFVEQPPPLDLLLTFVADEEDKSVGMEHLVKKWLPLISPPPIGAIFLEPTEENIGVSHKGFTWYELEITGRAAHGSRPEQGIDAILPLRAALEEMNNIQAGLIKSNAHPLLGHAAIHSSIIEGGTELSVIPGYSRLQWERRTLPGESQQGLQHELERIIQATENYPGNHIVKGRELFVRPPYSIPEDALVLRCLQKATPQSRPVGLSFWADSALAGQAGVPSVLFGPIGHGAHAVDEWVSLKSLVRVYEVLKEVMTDC